MKKLTKKVALLTRLSNAISAAIGKQLAKDGATVIVNYGNSRQVAGCVVPDILQAGSRVHAVQTDVTNECSFQCAV